MDMSGRITKVIGFSVLPTQAKEVEQLAKAERRTKSELFREMLRVYKRYRKQRDLAEDDWVMKLIWEAKEEQAENPMSVEDMLKESAELARYGAAQAKKLRIKEKDIPRIIQERRRKGAHT
jgi:hypothetical protein